MSIELVTAARHARGQGRRARVHVLAPESPTTAGRRPLCGPAPASGLAGVMADVVASCPRCVARALAAGPELLDALRLYGAVEEDTGYPMPAVRRPRATDDLIALGLLRRRQDGGDPHRYGPIVLTELGRPLADTPERIAARAARRDRRDLATFTQAIGVDPAILAALPSSAGPIGNPLAELPLPVTPSP